LQADKDKVIYFHVGLGKVASTYLQNRFFPKLKNIYYLPTNKYKHYHKIISNTNHKSYLVSREFDLQLEDEISRFSKYYPQAKLIIIFRRHSGWIASQYRRYIKNGGYLDFENYIDIQEDKGKWKQKDLYFYPMLQKIEKYYKQKPLVLFHDELKQDNFAFFDKIANFVNATYDKKSISLKRVHSSYSEKQLKIMKIFARLLFKQNPKRIKNNFLHWFQRRGRLYSCYLILYPAKLIPSFLVNKKPLTKKNTMDAIDQFYETDWQKCLEYAKLNNPK